MTRYVERITIDIEFEQDPSALWECPRGQLKSLWSSLGHILDARGKWSVSGPGIVCHITNLGGEEVPEEGGGDN